MTAGDGERATAPLWEPSAARSGRSALAAFLAAHGFASYDEAWEWSTDPSTAGAFWADIASEAGVTWHAPPTAALEADPDHVTGARWFPGGLVNYAERALTPPAGDGSATAVIAVSQTRDGTELSWGGMRSLVARVRRGLVEAGVERGDTVAGYLPNIPETLAAMLASASLGATWTCCAPEMGVQGVLDRLTQVAPVVLLAVDGYRYGKRTIDRRAEADEIRAGLPSLRAAAWLPYLNGPGSAPPDGWQAWDELTAKEGPLEFEPVPFDHPLYVLYSSGTTGKPKAIVHGHGGILLEHAKALRLHFDLGPGERFFWFTTTGWMMWNFCVSGLVVGAAVVLFDGDPAWPDPERLWEVMAETGTTCAGVGAGYLVAGMKAGAAPGEHYDLGALVTLGATGSPLPAAAAAWVYEAVRSDLLLASFSGGTDVCTGFVGASPMHPVWPGEISCRCLGARVEVFDDAGRPVVDEEGELVITAPLPSMPVAFVGDPEGRRYRAAYFERFPGIWAHGDRATLTSRGTVVISGRSDGTLNRGGVRMGTAEFYAVTEAFDDVVDSLVVHVEDPDGGPGSLWLFVVAGDEAGPPDGPGSLEDRLRAALRHDLSPRHVPDRIVRVPSVPKTLSGKKLEVPVKRILAGVPAGQALTLASVADPDSLRPFVELAASDAAG